MGIREYQSLDETASAEQPSIQRKSRSLWRELLGVTLLYILLSLVFTFPLILNFNSCVIGDMESDVWKHLWGMWWMRLNLCDQCTLPLSTHLLNAPYGGALFFIDSLNGVLSIPLQYAMGMPAVYNCMVLFNFVLAAVGAFLLCRYVCLNSYASFVGGAIYAFSAYMMAYINSGVTEAINIGWIPFFLLFFIRMLRRSSVRDAVCAAVFFSLATMGSWYYGAFCVLLGVFYYIFFVWRLGRRALALHNVSWSSLGHSVLSANFGYALATAVALGIYAHFTAAAVRPFGSELSTWSLSLWGFLGAVLMGAGWMQRKRLGLAALLWLAAVPAAVLAAAECLYFDSEVLYGYWGGLSFWLTLGQAAIIAALLGVWLYKQRAGRLWQAAFGADLKRSWHLLAVCAGIVFVYFCLFVVFQTSVGGDNWPGLLLCGLAIALLWLELRQLLSGWEDSTLEAAWLGGYLRIGRNGFGVWLLLSAVAVPILRRLFPDASLPGFTYLFFSALWLVLCGFSWMRHGAAVFARRHPDGGAGSGRGDWQLLFAAILSLLSDSNTKRILRRLVFVPLLFAVLVGMLIAAPTSAFNTSINGEDSLVFRKRVANSVDIHLSWRFRNISSLSAYFFGDKTCTNRTYTVDKLTRVSYAGWVALILAGLGFAMRRRSRTFWALMVLVFAMFSLGPYMYITPEICLSNPSPIYMAFFNYFPAFAQIAIPYRFVALVMLGLGVLSSLTLSSWYRAWSRRQAMLFSAALTAAVLFDVAVFSPAPFPIPLSDAVMPAYCASIGEDSDDVGLIDYPIQRYKGELLPGEYFYYQLAHGKAIPNRVEGTIPLFVFQNAFTNYLFVLEHAQEDLPPQTREKLAAGLADAARFRFRYLVIHNNLLRTSARERMRVLLQYFLGEPKHYPQGVDVYVIPPYSVLKNSTGAGVS